MMCKRLVLVLVLLCSVVGFVQAKTIVWVSRDSQDNAWMEWLASEGYTLDKVTIGANRVPTEDETNRMNAADLVIVSRRTDSAQLGDGPAKRTAWNNITTPIILNSAHLARSNRWAWINNSSDPDSVGQAHVVLDATDPVFAHLPIEENQAYALYAGNANVVAHNITNYNGNGTLITHRQDATNPRLYITRFAPGVEFYTGSGYAPAAERLYFPAAEFSPNFTDLGKAVYLNAVYHLTGATFNRPPFVIGAGDHIIDLGTEFVLNGVVTDDGGVENLTAMWSQVSGPGTASFGDASSPATTVTFDVKGTYVLELSAHDGEREATTTSTFYVRDPADNRLLSHWDFEGLPDPNILVDIVGGFNGVFYHDLAGQEPNVVAGHMSSTAVNFGSQQYWEVPGTTGNVDPNYTSTETGLTVAVWAKIESSPVTGAPMLIGYDLGGWRFQTNVGRWNLVQTGVGGAPQREVSSLRGAFRPEWQHVVGVFDGVNSQLGIYIDGILDNTQNVPSGYRIASGTMPLQIGNRADAARPWPGMVDDIRVYNYPLTDAEIALLAAQGDKAPYLTAGDDQVVFFKGEPVQLNATLLIDDGMPNPLTLNWSVQSVPFGTDPEDVTFSDPTIVNPFVMFPPEQGLYVLKLTGDDGIRQVEDTLTITLSTPTCADVLADGLAIPGDLSGPEGVPDCVVDIHDFVVFAASWLRCNNPADVTCEWPY